MNFLQKVWNWFNGNKTLFGAVILLVLQQGLVPEHTFGYQLLLWLGNMLAGVGVVHKLAKANTKAEPNK